MGLVPLHVQGEEVDVLDLRPATRGEPPKRGSMRGTGSWSAQTTSSSSPKSARPSQELPSSNKDPDTFRNGGVFGHEFPTYLLSRFFTLLCGGSSLPRSLGGLCFEDWKPINMSSGNKMDSKPKRMMGRAQVRAHQGEIS